MVEKVAKVRALREAFVDDLGGMYDADEIPETNSQELQNVHGSDKIIIEQNDIPKGNVVDANINVNEETGEVDMNEL